MQSVTSRKMRHYEVANIILDEMRLATIQETKEILEYRNGVYHRGAVFKILRRIQEIMEDDCTTNFRNEVLELIRVKTNHSIDHFDADPDILNIANGLLNIRIREINPHSSDYLSLNQLRVRYDPLARAKKFNHFMEQSLPDIDQRLLAIDFFASCLWRTCRLKKSLLLVGPTDTGKSTFLNLIIRFLGEENVSDVALQDLETNRFQLVNLVGKLANIYADIDKKELAQSRRFKTTTGGDRVTVEKKFMQSFETYIYAKDLFSANQIPDTQDESDAFFNRWIVIPFEEQVSPENQDKNLFEKLTTEKELSGILNILLKRLRWILKAKTIPNTPTVEETRSTWLGRSDFVRMFLGEKVQLEPESVLGRAEFYSLYISWCRLRKITPKSEVMFNRKVELLGAFKTQTRVEGEPRKVWKGIALRSIEVTLQSRENLQIKRKNRELRIQNGKGVPKATTFSNYYPKDEGLLAFALMMAQEEDKLAKEEALGQFTLLSNGLCQCGFCPIHRTTADAMKMHILEDHLSISQPDSDTDSDYAECSSENARPTM